MNTIPAPVGESSRDSASVRKIQARRDDPAVDVVRLPASWAQERLWFIDQLEKGSRAYNVPLAARLIGGLDRDALTRALDDLLQRHEVLRTVFVNQAGSPMQEIARKARFALQVDDLSGYGKAAQDAELSRQRAEEAAADFDLRRGPLIRGRLLRLSESEHLLFITLHHIIADGWSLGILFADLGELYAARVERRASRLEPLAVQYADYAVWQRQEYLGEPLEQEITYWRTQLAGAPPLLRLPTNRLRPMAQSYRGGNVALALDAQLTSRLKAMASRHKMTLFMVLHAAWALLMARLSGQDDLVIGSPIANRQCPELEGLIGFFANTLATRLNVKLSGSLGEYLGHVRQATLAAFNHQDVPFERIVSALQPERSLSRNPIFQVMLALQNAPKSELAMPGMTVTMEPGRDEPAMFDLFLSLEEEGGKIVGSLNYAADLFDRVTVERWLVCFQTLLGDMVQRTAGCIGDLTILPHSERNQVVSAFNATSAPYPRNLPIHELFEEQVNRTPELIALEYEGRALTYAELNRRANQLAAYLVSQGVRPDQVVGICMPRGLEIIVGLLGILKAGGAYLPLDPGYPSERLKQMLEDSAPQIVLTERKLAGLVTSAAAMCVALDEMNDQLAALSGEDAGAVDLGLSSENLVYVIYTSGSTGRPKGTAMRHRSVVNLIEWHRRTFGPGGGKRVLQFAALSFDVAFQEIFSTLCTGGTLVLLDEWVRRDVRALTELLQQRSVDRLFVPPIMLQSLAEHARSTGEIPISLKDVITAGEQLRLTSEIRALFRQLPGCRLHNHYGPTETHVVTALTLEGDPAIWPDLPPIGRPIDNSRIYVLDERMQPLPAGVAGEAYIGGANVARGYLNRPELTEQRFISDPFSADPEARLYRTGDLCCWRTDGTLDYLGRNDDQVKIRGFRIELGEIEAQLLRHGQVKEAAVVAREDVPGERRLVAYVTARGEDAPAIQDLRTSLKQVLPEHMVPSAYVLLEKLPLTPSGKLDRHALPMPDLASYISREYEAPEGEVEERLADIWQQLLHVERIGRTDNFFERGGHSLLIVQMLEKLRCIGLTTDVRCAFESPTLAGLGNLLRGAAEQMEVPQNRILPGYQTITPEMLPLVALEPEHIERITQLIQGGALNIQDIYPLVPLQEGILFHHLVDHERGDTYVIPMLFSVRSRQKLGELVQALQTVIDRHDILRTAFLWEQLPQPVQVVCRSARLPVEEIPPSEDGRQLLAMKARMDPRYQRIDVRRAPLLRLQVSQAEDKARWYALLQIHHLLCDHESLDLMLTEVAAYLEGRVGELPVPEPYRNHVAQVLSSARRRDAEAFFCRKLGDVEEPTAPYGLTDVYTESAQIEEAAESLEAQLANRIRTQARRLNVSAATIFHSAWALVVARSSARDDVVFGNVLMGRLQSSAGAHRVMGMFINTLPVRIRLRGLDARKLIEHTQREIVDLLEHEQASLAVAQRCSAIPGEVPLFTALLNYRHGAAGFESAKLQRAGIKIISTHGWTNYPLMCAVEEYPDRFALEISADRRIHAGRMLEYMRNALQSLIESLEEANDRPALELRILPEWESSRILNLYNPTQQSYPRHMLIQELFEAQVNSTPSACAVRSGREYMTYEQLNRAANRMAQLLMRRGVRANQVVGLSGSRTISMVVGLLAIIKSGGAYLPLDPGYPVARLRHMLQETNPQIVLGDDAVLRALSSSGREVISISSAMEDSANFSDKDTQVRKLGITSNDLVYVIYTSGSTGEPKGIAMRHRSVVNLIEWHRSMFGRGDCQRVLQFASLGFDVAFQEIFSTLCTGGTLVLIDEWTRRDAQLLIELLDREAIQRLFLPPIVLQSLAECCAERARWPETLEDVIVAGEQLKISPEIRTMFTALLKCRLHNHYGPTETHVVTSFTLQGEPARWPIFPPIGKPIPNARIYILDRQAQLVPTGVPGELYIGGAGVAAGYFNRPHLSDERFVSDQYNLEAGSKLYKTGDIGRWLEDGSIEYLGRTDEQIKLRGFRIELREIEIALARHEQVSEAAVAVHEDASGGKRLVAYVKLREPVAAADLRMYLRTRLPDYMIPSAFVRLEKLPLSPNGKLNRRLLPEPDFIENVNIEYEEPKGALEQALANIWKDLLDVSRVGANDNFFELGGNSILITKLIGRVEGKCKLRIPVSAVFKYPTVRLLAGSMTEAQCLGGSGTGASPKIDTGNL